MKYFVLAVALAACVRAESLDELSDFEGEGRLLFNTNTSLNSLIPDYRAVAAAVAIGLVLVAYVLRTGGSSVYDRNAYEYGQGYGYDQYGYQQDGYNGQSSFNARYGISNLATKMSQLESAFKKFEVETEECQKFVACEAAQLHKLKRNVPVVHIVNRILSTPGDESKVAPHLLEAFKAGQAEYKARNAEACVALRENCYRAHAAASNQ